MQWHWGSTSARRHGGTSAWRESRRGIAGEARVWLWREEGPTTCGMLGHHRYGGGAGCEPPARPSRDPWNTSAPTKSQSREPCSRCLSCMIKHLQLHLRTIVLTGCNSLHHPFIWAIGTPNVMLAPHGIPRLSGGLKAWARRLHEGRSPSLPRFEAIWREGDGPLKTGMESSGEHFGWGDGRSLPSRRSSVV
jgi:hypothetical protein